MRSNTTRGGDQPQPGRPARSLCWAGLSTSRSRGRLIVVAAFDRGLPHGGFPASHAGVVAVADESMTPVPPGVYTVRLDATCPRLSPVDDGFWSMEAPTPPPTSVACSPSSANTRGRGRRRHWSSLVMDGGGSIPAPRCCGWWDRVTVRVRGRRARRRPDRRYGAGAIALAWLAPFVATAAFSTPAQAQLSLSASVTQRLPVSRRLAGQRSAGAERQRRL